MNADITDRTALMMTNGEASKFCLSKGTSAKYCKFEEQKVIKDYSSSTKANLNQVEEWSLVKQKSENIQILINIPAYSTDLVLLMVVESTGSKIGAYNMSS